MSPSLLQHLKERKIVKYPPRPLPDSSGRIRGLCEALSIGRNLGHFLSHFRTDGCGLFRTDEGTGTAR